MQRPRIWIGLAAARWQFTVRGMPAWLRPDYRPRSDNHLSFHRRAPS